MAREEMHDDVIGAILRHHPRIQAVYMFGSWGTDREWPDSDVDIAPLFPHGAAKRIGAIGLSPLGAELEGLLGTNVDLVNLRVVSTVLQKEAIAPGRRIYCSDIRAADEFEMLTLSCYQKLNDEPRGILDQFMRTEKAYRV